MEVVCTTYILMFVLTVRALLFGVWSDFMPYSFTFEWISRIIWEVATLKVIADLFLQLLILFFLPLIVPFVPSSCFLVFHIPSLFCAPSPSPYLLSNPNPNLPDFCAVISTHAPSHHSCITLTLVFLLTPSPYCPFFPLTSFSLPHISPFLTTNLEKKWELFWTRSRANSDI